MKLIDDWKQAWRYLSVHAGMIGLSISLTYAEYYDKLKETFPPTLVATVTGIVFLIGIVLRVVNQNTKKDTEKS